MSPGVSCKCRVSPANTLAQAKRRELQSYVPMCPLQAEGSWQHPVPIRLGLCTQHACVTWVVRRRAWQARVATNCHLLLPVKAPLSR